jgi:hypothetical protein
MSAGSNNKLLRKSMYHCSSITVACSPRSLQHLHLDKPQAPMSTQGNNMNCHWCNKDSSSNADRLFTHEMWYVIYTIVISPPWCWQSFKLSFCLNMPREFLFLSTQSPFDFFSEVVSSQGSSRPTIINFKHCWKIDGIKNVKWLREH